MKLEPAGDGEAGTLPVDAESDELEEVVESDDCDDASDEYDNGGADAANDTLLKSAGIDRVRCSLMMFQGSYLVPMPGVPRCSVAGVAGVLNEFHWEETE